MANKAYEDIVIVLGDPKHEHRRNLRTALLAEGFRKLHDYGGQEAVREFVDRTPPDLIVVDMNMPDGDTCKLVRDIRRNELGINPFVPIIAVTWDANMDNVREAVDAGIDDLLVAPISVGGLLGRVKVLIQNRKPFVVTSLYIGPDRRKEPREQTHDAPSSRCRTRSARRRWVEPSISTN